MLMTLNKNKKTNKVKTIGFGFDSEETEHHFLVEIPKSNKTQDHSVIIYERFEWQADASKQKINYREDRTKAQLGRVKWDAIKDALKYDFNTRLKEEKIKAGDWKASGQVAMHKLFGKEALVLIWAVEDCETNLVTTAINNWLGLRPEERWWLYTMTNANTGNVNDRKGWRKALRFALTENPYIEVEARPNVFGPLFT
jgi:hypothetical protein